MQTPQIMRRADLEEAFENCPIPLDQVTDDVQLIELIGKEVLPQVRSLLDLLDAVLVRLREEAA